VSLDVSAASAGPVSGDADRLQQVVWNLLSNAIKFTPKGGRVEIRLERVDTAARITVSDTGSGISPEFLPYVFDRFRQAGDSGGGLGLGLALVQHFVELHGGWVRAESPGEGHGATFTVELPLALVAADEAELKRTYRDRRTLPPLAGLRGLRVLVVDDEADARELLTTVLEQSGAEVTAVGSTADALGALQRWRPDVLVSDLGISGEDGYALIRRVRALAPEQGGETPAIAVTAYARIEDRLRAASAGFQMHVAKPAEPADLVAAILRLVRPTGPVADAA
jgi:CheY-like chemotaxis protein